MLGLVGRDASGFVDQNQSKQINIWGVSRTSIHPTEDNKNDYGIVMDKFDSFLNVRKNIIFEQARFNR